MGILNINTIQANINNDDVLKYTDEYVKEALTNLGQRVGAKGDSLSVDGFTIREIIKDLEVVESLSSNESVNKNYIIAYDDSTNGIVIDYDGKIYKFNDFNTVDYSNDTANNTFTTLESAKGETQSLFVNYKISNTDNGKFFISKDCDAHSNDVEIKRILALEFDKKQKLTNYVYVQLHETYADVYSSLKNGNKRYELNILNVQTLYDELYNTCFKTNSDNNIESIYENICTFLKDANISNITIDRNYNLETYWETVLISYINSIFNDTIFNINNQYTGLKQYIIYSVLNHIISDIAVNDNINFLKIYINDDYVFRYFINDNTKQIYYSYDFNIHYVNNIDEDTFTESYITDNNLDNNYIFVATNLNTIPEKITNNRFVVSYIFDTLLNTLFLDNIIIDLNYTLPYIFTSNNPKDTNKYWYINDEFTNIQSNGKNAGQPNILILGYTKLNDDTTKADILHTFVSDEIKESEINEHFNDSYTTFKYALDKVVSINENPGNVFEFNIKLPDINALITYNSSYEHVFANCLLWTVVDTKLGTLNDITLYQKLNLKENKNETNSSNNTSYVTVFWHPVLTNNVWDWECLKDPANDTIALDFGTLCGLTETTYYLLNTKYEPDNYLHSYVIFDKVNNTTPKNTQQNADTDNYTRYPALLITGEDESQTLDSRAESNICEFRPMFLTTKEVVTTINTGVLDEPAEIDSETKESTVFNNIKTINIPDSTTKGDYIPGSDSTGFAPLFNFGSVLTYNQTALNRISLISIDKKDDTVNVYNSYIGFEGNQRRNELTIGTSKTNTNIKNDGRLNVDKSLKQHNRLNVRMPLLAHQGVLNKSAISNNKKTKVFYIIISDIVKNVKTYLKEDTDIVNGTKYMGAFNKVVDCFDILSYLKNVIKLNNIIKSPKTKKAPTVIKLQSKYTDDDIISIIVFLEETNALFQIINANEIISPDNIFSKYGIQQKENDFFDKYLQNNFTGDVVDDDVFIPEFSNTPFESY